MGAHGKIDSLIMTPAMTGYGKNRKGFQGYGLLGLVAIEALFQNLKRGDWASYCPNESWKATPFAHIPHPPSPGCKQERATLGSQPPLGADRRPMLRTRMAITDPVSIKYPIARVAI